MLQEPEKFFNICRAGVMSDGGGLDQGEVDGANAVMKASEGWPIAWVAYALATTWHETAHTMQPIKEYGGDPYFWRMYDIEGNRPQVAKNLGNVCPGDGVKFAGRGYVMITGRDNYKKASTVCGVDLVRFPDRAMEPDIAALILRDGMEKCWFTSIALRDRLPKNGIADRQQFRRARQIINRLDKADLIAKYALQFQAALEAGKWIRQTATA